MFYLPVGAVGEIMRSIGKVGTSGGVGKNGDRFPQPPLVPLLIYYVLSPSLGGG